jgi:hypothetical protein
MNRSAIHFCRAACFAALLATPFATADAADGASPVPGGLAPPPGQHDTPLNVRVGLLMLTMPEEKFLTLLPDLLDKEKIEKTVPQLLDAVKRKEITLEGYQIIVTKSGQRAVTETVLEYNAGQNSFPFFYPGYPYPGYPNPGYIPVTPTTPTSFEARNIGATLEVEPFIEPDGRHIGLNLSPQHVEFFGFADFFLDQKRDPFTGLKMDLHQPIFFTSKTTTSVTLVSGQHLLLAVHKKEKPAGMVEIFILDTKLVPAAK